MARLLSFFVALLIVAQSAVAAPWGEGTPRPGTGGGERVILCTDQGAVAVILGADGVPVPSGSTHRHCPDCLPLNQVADGASGGVALAPRPVSVTQAWLSVARPRPAPCARSRAEPARGPPTGI